MTSLRLFCHSVGISFRLEFLSVKDIKNSTSLSISPDGSENPRRD